MEQDRIPEYILQGGIIKQNQKTMNSVCQSFYLIFVQILGIFFSEKADVAQQAEHLTCNERVTRSIRVIGSI